MPTHVTATPAASSEIAAHHFEGILAFETDCWDVYESLRSGAPRSAGEDNDRRREGLAEIHATLDGAAYSADATWANGAARVR
jgi:hypothetical protein